MRMKSQVWFVIVTYQPDSELLRLLVAALKGWSVVVVDNTENNLGYGAAANQGMKQAFDAGADWVIVVNQDVMISKKGINEYIRQLEIMPPGIVGSEAGTLDPKRWTTVLALRHVRQAQCKPGLEAGSRIDYISGAFMAIHRDVWQATQGFYEPYFMYYEDADLSVRARKLGFPLRQMSIDGFRHNSTNSKNNCKVYYLARNHLLFVRRLAPLSVKVHELLRILKTIIEHHKQGNTEAIAGISDFAIGRFYSH